MVSQSLINFFLYFCTITFPHQHSACVVFLYECYENNAAMTFPDTEDSAALEFCMEKSEVYVPSNKKYNVKDTIESNKY